jgi:hypothetical protein
MWFILLGTIVVTDLTESYSFVLGHLLFANEKTSVSAFDVAYSLKQATGFACKAVLPNGTVGFGFDEVAILKYIASDVINDGSNVVTESALTGEFVLCITPYVFPRSACVAAIYLCAGKEVVGLRSINGIKASVMAESMRWTWLDWCWAQVQA